MACGVGQRRYWSHTLHVLKRTTLRATWFLWKKIAAPAEAASKHTTEVSYQGRYLVYEISRCAWMHGHVQNCKSVSSRLAHFAQCCQSLLMLSRAAEHRGLREAPLTRISAVASRCSRKGDISSLRLSGAFGCTATSRIVSQ